MSEGKLLQNTKGKPMTTTYRTDFYVWTQRQADLLRNEDYADLDLPNLIEEIEALGASERRELKSRLTTILEHMLKLTCEPESRACRKWRRTILTQRITLAEFLRENYTLRSTVADFIPDAYRDARKLAVAGTKCEITAFPTECPWLAAQILDEAFMPTAP